MLHDTAAIAARAVRMVTDGVVTTIDGDDIAFTPDSMCVHGDTPGAVEIARSVRAALEGAGISIEPFAG